MRIAQVSFGIQTYPPDGWGAIEKIVWNYLVEMKKLGNEVNIVYASDIKKDDYDIVHVHVWNHAFEMYEKGIPYVFTCHDHHSVVHGKNSEVYKNNLIAMKNSVLSIVPAKFLVEYFDNVPIYLPHGISLNQYSLNIPNENKKILCVGNNGLIGDASFDRKGFSYAIEAANLLNMNITIAGPTNSNADFFKSNPDLIKDNVTIKYDLSDNALKSLYSTHDILVHASSVEAGHPPLTLLEAAASGLPIISTECNGDLYSINVGRNVDEIVNAIKQVATNYDVHRNKTMHSVSNFQWSDIVKKLVTMYSDRVISGMKKSALNIYNNAVRQDIENYVNINFIDGPFVEVTGQKKKRYKVSFIDSSTSELIYKSEIGNNQWSRPNRKWYTEWLVKLQSETGEYFEHKFDLKGRRVLISFESSSLGDTIAWIPYVEEFRKKHNCHVIVSTFKNDLFKSEYPELEFLEPGTPVEGVYALYRLGVFYDENGVDLSKHKTDFRKLSLQEYASDILGLEYEEIRPRIKRMKPMTSEKPYICIANHSTAQTKYWNNSNGWQELVDYVKSIGYDVYLLSKEENGYMGNKTPNGIIPTNGKSLDEIIPILLGSNGFVGLSSGISWLSWALQVPTILISGFSEPYQEMKDVYRIINEDVCHGCFARHLFDKGDWNWCPDHKGTDRQFECTKSITFQMVKPKIDKMLNL
jgi:autotransporter strand-loop-strand O-heptosyltransferase